MRAVAPWASHNNFFQNIRIRCGRCIGKKAYYRCKRSLVGWLERFSAAMMNVIVYVAGVHVERESEWLKLRAHLLGNRLFFVDKQRDKIWERFPLLIGYWLVSPMKLEWERVKHLLLAASKVVVYCLWHSAFWLFLDFRALECLVGRRA